MLPVELSRASEADLQALVDAKVKEGRNLEFKKDFDFDRAPDRGEKDKARTEFANDILSFANEQGSDYLVGISERLSSGRSTGEAGSLTGIEISNFDSLDRQIRAIFRDHIEPRILGLQTLAVPLANSRRVFVIRVPQSPIGPHMNTKTGAIYGRDASSKFRWGIDLVRRAVLQAGSISDRVAERMDGFIVDVESASQRDRGTPRFLLQILPTQAITGFGGIDIPRAYPAFDDLKLIDEAPWSKRLVFDGVLGQTLVRIGDKVLGMRTSSVLLSRTSRIDLWTTLGFASKPVPGVNGPGHLVDSKFIADYSSRFIASALQIVSDLGAQPPYFVSSALLNARGCILVEDEENLHRLHIAEGSLRFPTLVIESSDASLGDLLKAIRPLFDALANAAGHIASPAFNADGSLRVGV